MRTIVMLALFSALALVADVGGAAEMRGGGAGGEIHDGRGFGREGGFPRGGMGNGEIRGGGRGVAPGGEMHGRGDRDEHGESREGHHRDFDRDERHHRDYDEGGIFIYPGPYYYPAEPDYQYESPDYAPPDQPGYLYYCEDPAGYFPNVVQCPEGWEEVPTDDQ